MQDILDSIFVAPFPFGSERCSSRFDRLQIPSDGLHNPTHKNRSKDGLCQIQKVWQWD